MAERLPSFGRELHFEYKLVRVAHLPAAGRVSPSHCAKQRGQGRKALHLSTQG